MISKQILELMYQAAHIQRWNDHLRPDKGFTELDKQAHKMVIAYVLARCEEDRGKKIRWKQLIEGCMFEFFHRVMLTDIKPPIYHRLMKESGEELNRWVLNQLEGKMQHIKGDFYGRFAQYLLDPEYCKFERKIIRAAHYLATNWEFGIVYSMNSSIYGVEQTRERIENELEDHYDLLGVQKIGLSRKTHKFIDLVGQLRFQLRWAQSPRVPKTSVLGHMLVVAMFAYFCSVELWACDRRIYNNFFGGLFHDLPEVLTRDIVSPVKRSVEGLEELIKRIENSQVEERILPLLPISWHDEIKYFIDDEFASKVVLNDAVVKVDADQIGTSYNSDMYNPLDGVIIRACDELAAYLEAHFSIKHGISSEHLQEGREHVYDKYKDSVICGLDFGRLYRSFM